MSKQFCTFYVAGLFFGVDVSTVQEVIRYQETTPVPLAAPEIRGCINLRGQIVTAVDLRQRLGLGGYRREDHPMNVIVRHGGEAVSLLTDQVGDVCEVERDLFEPPPETLTGPARELITGVYKLPERLLHLLDVERALALDA